jgi:hypothetical protein
MGRAGERDGIGRGLAGGRAGLGAGEADGGFGEAGRLGLRLGELDGEGLGAAGSGTVTTIMPWATLPSASTIS